MSLVIALGAGAGMPAGQTAADRYRAAQKVFMAHSEDGFKHDDSAAALDAMKEMSAASEAAVVEVLGREPGAGAKEIEDTLCRLDPEADCGQENFKSGAVEIGDRLFLAQDRTGEMGTIFLAGMRDGRPAVLWRIEQAGAQTVDAHGFLEAWRPENSGGACMEREQKSDDFSRCGPLYASVGGLPADAEGRPRFYVDAGYAQLAGATVLNQTSVWRWEGAKATLLWIDTHGFMIDQKEGTAFEDGILSIGEKDEFRTFYSCGGCEGRQVWHRLRILPEGVEDLGKTPVTPELDLVDELFWRLANGRSTDDIATPEAVRYFRQPIKEAKRRSKKIEPEWFSTGMMDDFSITKTGSTERLCFTSDEIGQVYFTIAVSAGGRMRLAHVEEAQGRYDRCAAGPD